VKVSAAIKLLDIFDAKEQLKAKEEKTLPLFGDIFHWRKQEG
jgi:hypothetical protein